MEAAVWVYESKNRHGADLVSPHAPELGRQNRPCRKVSASLSSGLHHDATGPDAQSLCRAGCAGPFPEDAVRLRECPGEVSHTCNSASAALALHRPNLRCAMSHHQGQ